MKRPYLLVCLCVENEDQCVVALNEIAAGNVFGPQQRLKLVLHSQNVDALQDLVSSVQDSCYSLVNEISIASSSPVNYDVTLLLLSSKALSTSPQSLQRSQDQSSFIGFITSISNLLQDQLNDNMKILVLGSRSNTAASILSHRLGSVGGNQLLAFDSKENAGGQYNTAYTMCNTVADWWHGRKNLSGKIKAGIKFYGKNGVTSTHPGGMFLSAPVNIVGEKTFKICPSFHINTDELQRELYRTETALKEMKRIDGVYSEHDVRTSGLQALL